MGRENRYFKVGGLRFLQDLTPQERYSRFIVASPSGPLSRGGKGGGGKGQMRLRLPWERFCAGYGLIYGGSRKSIRTAHRIAPKVAAAHLPFPPTPFPDGGKGARMGWQL